MLTDNAALNSILALAVKIEKSVRNGYSSVIGSTYVASLADPALRAANSNAVRTVITNLGPLVVRIYESNKLVRSLPVNETWTSPTNGAGTIKVDTASTGSTVSIATYLQ